MELVQSEHYQWKVRVYQIEYLIFAFTCTFDDEKKCFPYYFLTILHTIFPGNDSHFSRDWRLCHMRLTESKVLQECLHVRLFLPNRLTIFHPDHILYYKKDFKSVLLTN